MWTILSVQKVLSRSGRATRRWPIRVSSNREKLEIAGILVSTGKNRDFLTNRECYSFFGKQWEFLLKGEKSRKTPTKNWESQPYKIVKIPGKNVKMTREKPGNNWEFCFPELLDTLPTLKI